MVLHEQLRCHSIQFVWRCCISFSNHIHGFKVTAFKLNVSFCELNYSKRRHVSTVYLSSMYWILEKLYRPVVWSVLFCWAGSGMLKRSVFHSPLNVTCCRCLLAIPIAIESKTARGWGIRQSTSGFAGFASARSFETTLWCAITLSLPRPILF